MREIVLTMVVIGLMLSTAILGLNAASQRLELVADNARLAQAEDALKAADKVLKDTMERGCSLEKQK